MFHTVAVSVLAQTAVTLRIYAVTERNKWIGGALSVTILAQISFGTYYLVRTVINPRKSPNILFVCDMNSSVPSCTAATGRLGPVPHLLCRTVGTWGPHIHDHSFLFW